MEIIDVLQRTALILEELKIPYMISGSAASSFHAFVRSTQDGDLVVDLGSEKVEAFVAAFLSEFYLDPPSIRHALETGRSFNLIHLESSIKIDFFPLRKRKFSLQEFSRRQPRLLLKDSAAPAFVATAEDTILAKLEWFRAGGELSENQWRDVIGILKVQAHTLDSTYLKEWAADLDVEDLLTKALEEAGR